MNNLKMFKLQNYEEAEILFSFWYGSAHYKGCGFSSWFIVAKLWFRDCGDDEQVILSWIFTGLSRTATPL